MKDLESKLREIALRAPSGELDRRVMAQKPERPVQPSPAPWRIPLWLAGAVAVTMAVAGFAAGLAWRGRPAPPPRSTLMPATIQVIYRSPSEANPFDFTPASDIFPAGKMEAKIQVKKGV